MVSDTPKQRGTVTTVGTSQGLAFAGASFGAAALQSGERTEKQETDRLKDGEQTEKTTK